ncbi:Serine/threonine-protein kinase nekl-2 [Colletotrichum siamense]|uniref:Serine/threonine-protein kinase nekl-2 n=1 Tax=Colletotrichum siamense TaxID=690259 RepID=UPI0018730638|nr:Serine/threonine-protein kinase nekl-2 [Colletotrichum siamense]KAF5497307.1 Serine/threonine-protein kinase nekl-2 [Colletotrichum siamense]
MDLFARLGEAYSEDKLGNRRYIATSELEQLVTKETVEKELRLTQKRGMLSLFRAKRQARVKLAERVMEKGRKLFATCVYLSQPWGVKLLLDAHFTDHDLPLTKNGNSLTCEKSGSKRLDWPADWELPKLDVFVDKQWLFLAPVFSTTGNHQTIDPMCPLPFSSVDEVKGTNNNVVFKAMVHPSHQKGFENETPRLKVALKEFKYKQDFQQEFNNLDKIRDLEHAKHITQKLDSFRQGNKNYIIFPWADGGDLVDVWENMDVEERSPELALWGLEQMLGLAEALQALHDEMRDQENCRHGDLKPGNILHFKTRGYGILKVADFGISKVHVLGTLQRNDPTTTKATTPAYQAPEGDSSKTRSRKYDIWSLGCIFLEFTLWIARRNTAVKTFDAVRKAKTPGDEAYFYEKVENEPVVLHEVQKAFRDLRSLAKCGEDTAFGHLLDIIENDMIKVKVEERIEAGLLCDRLERILKRAREDTVYLFKDGSGIDS